MIHEDIARRLVAELNKIIKERRLVAGWAGEKHQNITVPDILGALEIIRHLLTEEYLKDKMNGHDA